MSGAGDLTRVLDRFAQLHILVVGDLMLDRFIWGDVDRLSPEAPVPVLRVCSESWRLGGAANVVANIRTLGAQVSACGVVGVDAPGKTLIAELLRIGVTTRGVFADAELQSIQKTRVIARPSHQQIVRLDRENPCGIRNGLLKKVRSFVVDQAKRFDAVVVSDYGKGVIHPELLTVLAAAAAKHGMHLIIDPKQENFGHYHRPSLITPNKDEAGAAAGITIRDEQSLRAAGERLVRKWRAHAVLITRGPDGMSLFRPRRGLRHFPTQAREIFDVTGAGDTVVAVCALALAAGAGYEQAAILANYAAGFVGDEVGTVAVPLAKLYGAVKELS